MSIKEFLSLPLLAIFILLFSLSFFLNYLSSLYTEASLFKIDLITKKNQQTKKLIFILKNSNLLFAIVCICQVFLNIFLSEIFVSSWSRPLLEQKGWENYRWAVIALLGVLIALFTEIFSRYLASRPDNQKKIFNKFFINFAYSLIRPPYHFLRSTVKSRKKIFVNSEKDVIRFINNLTADNILEKREAKLIQSAFNFDELKVGSIITPWKIVTTLNYGMTYQEIQTIHSQQFFTRYPVINQKEEIIGIFNIDVFYWKLITKKNKNPYWQNYIDKKVFYFSPQDRLDKALTELQTNKCRLAIVKQKKRLLGIITLQDVLETLVGKIKDEREISLLPPRRLN